MNVRQLIDLFFEKYDEDTGNEYYARKSDNHVLIADGRHDLPEILALVNIMEDGNILILGSDPEQDPVIDTFDDRTELSQVTVYKKI